MLSKWTFRVKNESTKARTQQVMLPMPFPDEPWPGGRIVCTKGLGSTYEMPWFRIAAYHNPSNPEKIGNPRFIQVLTPAVTFSAGEEKEFELQIGTAGTNPIAEPINPIKVHEEPSKGDIVTSEPIGTQPIIKEGNIRSRSTGTAKIFKPTPGDIVTKEPIKGSGVYVGGKVPVCHFTGAVEFDENFLTAQSLVLYFDGDYYDIGYIGTPMFSWGQGGLVMKKNVTITNRFKTELHLRVYTTIMPDSPFIKVLCILENQPYEQIAKSGDAAVAPIYWGERGGSGGGVGFLFSNPALLVRRDKHPGNLYQTTYNGDKYYEWRIWEDPYIEFLGTWQGKAWEFLVYPNQNDVSYLQVVDYVRNGTVPSGANSKVLSWLAEDEAPLWALPDIETLREAKAWWFGGIKSPLNPEDWTTLTNFRNSWDSAFNTYYGKDWSYWGGAGQNEAFGDDKHSATTGTPRNSQGELWAMRAIQGKRSQYLKLTVERARAQVLRPLARCFMSVLSQTSKLKNTYFLQFKVYKQGLGEQWGCYKEHIYRVGKATPDPRGDHNMGNADVYEHPHGWDPANFGHIAAEMLADAHIFTADPFSWDELDFYGKTIKYAWPNPPDGAFGGGTSFGPANWPSETRREGLVALVGALAYQVTGNLDPWQHLHDRARMLESFRKTLTGFPDTPYQLEHDNELNENYTKIGTKLKATTLFQSGHYVHGMLAVGWPQNAWDQILGHCLPYHAWELKDWDTGAGRPKGQPAYYYEIRPAYNSPSKDPSSGKWKPRREWWSRSVGSFGTMGMIVSAMRYAIATHPQKTMRALIENRLRDMLAYYGHAYQPNPASTGDGDKWWEWWDAEVT